MNYWILYDRVGNTQKTSQTKFSHTDTTDNESEGAVVTYVVI